MCTVVIPPGLEVEPDWMAVSVVDPQADQEDGLLSATPAEGFDGLALQVAIALEVARRAFAIVKHEAFDVESVEAGGLCVVVGRDRLVVLLRPADNVGQVPLSSPDNFDHNALSTQARYA